MFITTREIQVLLLSSVALLTCHLMFSVNSLLLLHNFFGIFYINMILLKGSVNNVHIFHLFLLPGLPFTPRKLSNYHFVLMHTNNRLCCFFEIGSFPF